MASGQTFESDLRAVREARGLSLPEIHQQTRIPVDVLRRFEDGDLVSDPTYNEVYLKAFLSGYAKAIGVPPSAALVAYEDQKAGAYRGALHPDGPTAETPQEATAPATPSAPPPSAPASATPSAPASEPPSAPPADEDPTPAPRAPEAPPSRPPASDAPPAVEALRQAPDPATKRPSSEPPKTLAEARVGRPVVAGANRSFDKNWTTILGLFVVVLAVIAGALYFLVFAGDDGPAPPTEPVAEAAETETATETVGPAQERAPAGGPELQLPLNVELLAGGDGLQSFRVTVDDGARRPYWIEPGDSESFTAQQSVVLWGEDPTGDFSEATVEIQGLRFTPPSGREFVISAENGQRVLDSLATAGATPTP